MEWLHKHHMKITLNVHPADGIRAYEDAYERVASKMGMDPEKKEPVLFDVTDPKFMEVYFEEFKVTRTKCQKTADALPTFFN